MKKLADETQPNPRLDSADGILTVGADRRISYANNAALKRLGYTREEVMGALCYKLLSGSDYTGICNQQCIPVKNTVRKRLTNTFDAVWTTKDGRQRNFNVSTLISKKPNRAGDTIHIFRDTTEDSFIQKTVNMRTGDDLDLLRDKFTREITKREKQVLRLVAAGLSNSEIAKVLFVQPVTVRNHVTRIMEKLLVKTKLHAVLLAMRAGFI